ncbi:MAG: hypothetical protein VX762_01055 [Bacteroidota bacterium]|nr:hypothetical protein [Bacteroidota bacterium]
MKQLMMEEVKPSQKRCKKASKLSQYKNTVLTDFPKAKLVYIKGSPRIFLDGKDISTQHLMPIPKTEEETWFNATQYLFFIDGWKNSSYLEQRYLAEQIA